MKKPEHLPDLCPRFHAAVELIGRRWTGAILYLLLGAPARFVELRQAIPGITDPMLANRLRALEGEGVIEREVEPGTPVRVRYSLTPKGRALQGVMGAIGEWSHDWVPATRPAAPKPLAAAKERRKSSPRKASAAR